MTPEERKQYDELMRAPTEKEQKAFDAIVSRMSGDPTEKDLAALRQYLESDAPPSLLIMAGELAEIEYLD